MELQPVTSAAPDQNGAQDTETYGTPIVEAEPNQLDTYAKPAVAAEEIVVETRDYTKDPNVIEEPGLGAALKGVRDVIQSRGQESVADRNAENAIHVPVATDNPAALVAPVLPDAENRKMYETSSVNLQNVIDGIVGRLQEQGSEAVALVAQAMMEQANTKVKASYIDSLKTSVWAAQERLGFMTAEEKSRREADLLLHQFAQHEARNLEARATSSARAAKKVERTSKRIAARVNHLAGQQEAAIQLQIQRNEESLKLRNIQQDDPLGRAADAAVQVVGAAKHKLGELAQQAKVALRRGSNESAEAETTTEEDTSVATQSLGGAMGELGQALGQAVRQTVQVSRTRNRIHRTDRQIQRTTEAAQKQSVALEGRDHAGDVYEGLTQERNSSLDQAAQLRRGPHGIVDYIASQLAELTPDQLVQIMGTSTRQMYLAETKGYAGKAVVDRVNRASSQDIAQRLAEQIVNNRTARSAGLHEAVQHLPSILDGYYEASLTKAEARRHRIAQMIAPVAIALGGLAVAPFLPREKK